MELMSLLVTGVAVAMASVDWLFWSLVPAFRTRLNDRMTAQIAASAALVFQCSLEAGRAR